MAVVSTPPSVALPRLDAQRVLDSVWVQRLLTLALCVYLFGYGITAGELWRTENLRAIIAAEFLRGGDWVVPTLYGEPLYTKPPGMYAAIGLASWPLGRVTEFTARLPSVIAATLTVLLVAGLFRRLLGGWAGLVAAVVVPTSFMWLDKATTAEIDTLQVFWVTAAVFFFLRALERQEIMTNDGMTNVERMTKHEARTPGGNTAATSSFVIGHSFVIRHSSFVIWGAALLCVAGGVLTKWTAPAFFYLTVIPLLWWRGRLRLLWGRHHLVSAAVGAGVCFAWVAAAVARTGWEPFWETVSREALQRLSPAHHLEALSTLAPSHRTALGPWVGMLLHPFVVLASNLPWSLAALWTLRPGFARLWDERGRFLLQALHCWTWPNLLFWSVVSEHSPRHSFPLFPGMAGLAAMVWVAWLRGDMGWPLLRVRPVSVFAGTLALWLVVKLAFVHAVIPHRNQGREPRAKGEQLAALVPDGATLYLFRLKDEGILFYYGRPARRLAGPDQLPATGEPLYCILDETEAGRWPGEVVWRSTDEQGAPIVLVRRNP